MSYLLDASIVESLLATILMSIAMALIGTICVVKKKSLNGEMMSHAALPGVALAYLLVGKVSQQNEILFSFFILILAFAFCLASQKLSSILIRKKISEDATLCLILSFGLGLGILIQSLLQKSHPIWYKKSQLFFYGQAATLMWEHVVIYALLAISLLSFILLAHYRLKWFLFDQDFFKAHGLKIKMIDFMIDALVAIAIVIGIRSCGVILVSGMLIIPVIAAKKWSSSLKGIYFLSSVFAAFSAFLGNYFSFSIPILLLEKYGKTASIALGPLMIIFAFVLAFLSLVFAPKTGWISCQIKQLLNHLKIIRENCLKKLWKNRDHEDFSKEDLKKIWGVRGLLFYLLVWHFKSQKYLKERNFIYILTKKGLQQGAHIVRIHRLFELYLSKELHVDLKNVHGIAEELEHFISDDMENEITFLLNNPAKDPHHQPIPKGKAEG